MKLNNDARNENCFDFLSLCDTAEMCRDMWTRDFQPV